jgi:DNA uptake protein ComE-like DNA-binding protein
MPFKTAMGFSVQRKTIAVFFVLFCLGILLYFRAQKQAIPTHTMLQLDSLLQEHIDSLKTLGSPKTIYPFNPNFISDQRGYFLGLSPQEIDRLKSFRAKGKWVNSVKEFQKVTLVDTTWLSIYTPYFNFPSRANHQVNKKKNNSIPPIDLNRAIAKDFQKINGIGEVLSNRIIRYRERLQGYSQEAQLTEVYGLSKAVVANLQDRCSIITKPTFDKLSLQEASLAELSKLPYLSYEEARKVVQLRTDLKGMSFSNLHSIKGFDSLKIKRLALYLF